MKFTCTQENLNQGLSIVSHIASKNTTLPILNNVLIKAENGVISLTTTNLELGMNCIVRGKIDSEGSFTVGSRLLTDFVGLISTNTVEVDLSGDVLEIKSEKTETKIKGNPSEEFPLIPDIKRENSFTCKAGDLMKAINQVIFSVSTSESRPEISGVYMKFENGSLVLATTDSYRLAEKSIRCNGVESKEVIVPSRAMGELHRVLSTLGVSGTTSTEGAESKDEVEIFFQDNQALFSYKNVQLVSRLIEGTYPAYKQIIPKGFKTKTILPVGECQKAVKTASLFSRLGVFDVTFELKNGKAIISGTNAQLGQSTSEVEVKIDGEGGKIVLNHKFLTDGLSALNTGSCSFEMNDESSPCLLRPCESFEGSEPVISQDYLYIIMPIKQ